MSWCGDKGEAPKRIPAYICYDRHVSYTVRQAFCLPCNDLHRLTGEPMRYHLCAFQTRLCASCLGMALSLLTLAPSAARADTPAKIDLSQTNYQPAYPASAKDKDEHGDVTLGIYVETTGKPSKVSVDKTSGFADLDQAAVAAVQAWHFVPATTGGAAAPGWTSVLIHFQVSNAAQNGDNQAYAATDDDNQIICKRDVSATGSHILPPPVCHPKRVWDKATAESVEALRRTMEQGTISTAH